MLAGLTALLGGGDSGGSSFESIATVTASGGQTTLTLSSIPSTYKHLQIRGIARLNAGGSASFSDSLLRFNSDTGNNYTYHYLQGNGSSASAYGQGTSGGSPAAILGAGSGLGASIYAVNIIDILDYSSTSKYKTVRNLTASLCTYEIGEGHHA